MDAVLLKPDGDLGAGVEDRPDVFVGVAEVVALGALRVGLGIGEDDVDVHHVGVGPVAVVQAREREAGFAVVVRQVHQAPRPERAGIDPVQRADFADDLGAVHAYVGRLVRRWP